MGDKRRHQIRQFAKCEQICLHTSKLLVETTPLSLYCTRSVLLNKNNTDHTQNTIQLNRANFKVLHAPIWNKFASTVFNWPRHSTNQPINQPTNQPTNHPTNRSEHFVKKGWAGWNKLHIMVVQRKAKPINPVSCRNIITVRQTNNRQGLSTS